MVTYKVKFDDDAVDMRTKYLMMIDGIILQSIEDDYFISYVKIKQLRQQNTNCAKLNAETATAIGEKSKKDIDKLPKV